MGVQVNAQIGIGTIEPATSSMLDVQSSSKGFLAPRMTTAQRTAIVQPANSLLVFDTNLQQYYFYDAVASQWRPIGSSTQTRNNYKIIKSETDLAPELAAGGGSKYLLTANTLYEINGTIVLNHSIDLNEAYVIGEDTNEDVLVRNGGTLFLGSNGGSIRGLTLSAPSGTVFNLNGTTGKNLIFRDAIVANSGSVGTISNYGLFFSSVIQFVGNSNGITYTNIAQLLLNNQGWAGSNGGSFESFTGTFNSIQKVSGFSTVPSGATGLNVSANPTVGNATLLGTVFSGAGNYVNPYNTGEIYSGYNFTKNWNVNAPGIPRESDDVASGTIYIERNSTTSNPSFSILNSSPVQGTTQASNLFRMSASVGGINDNVLVYRGKVTRTFSVRGTLSYESLNGSTSTIHAFYVRRYNSSGASIEIPLGTEVYEQVDENLKVRAIPLAGTIVLNPGDYIRVFGQVISGNRSSIRAYSLSLSLD